MKKFYLTLLTLLCAGASLPGLHAAAEDSISALEAKLSGAPKEVKDITKEETLTRDGYTLKITVKDKDFPLPLRERMIDTFFIVYPKMSADFNPGSPKTVTFIVEEKINVPAYASGGRIHFNGEWMRKARGNDIDVITHEAMHVVQSYSRGGPGWITEGIADYARNKYGVDNKGNGWSMPEVRETHKYTDAYRVTARFFTWLENRVNKGIIQKLDGVMRDGKYSDDFWKNNTGKTVDELWQIYVDDSKLEGDPLKLEAPARTREIKRNGYTLNIKITDSEFPEDVARKMAETFFVVYPKLQAKFAPNGSKTVNFVIQEKNEVGGGRAVPAYAHFHNSTVHFSSKWMRDREGNDIDVVTHELTHIVQSYPHKPGSQRPGWITEGLADYAREVFGVDNKGSGWALPEYNERQKYTDAYRVTARFFVWLEQNINKELIVNVDKVMRDGTYTDGFWKEQTGKTIDELWAEYAKNPVLKPITAGAEAPPPPRRRARNNNTAAAEQAPTKTIVKNGYTLDIIQQDETFPAEVLAKMTDTFFVVYPKLQAKFNPNSAKKVTFIIREFDGVAHTYMHNANVHFNSKWMRDRKGNDIDVVTHELTHVVQAYANKRGESRPGWVTEGLADYARYKFGVDNKGSDWALPNYSDRQKYTDAYRVTGRFFAWLEENTDKEILTKVDKAMRDGTYSDEIWKKITGKTIDELWADYGKNPALK